MEDRVVFQQWNLLLFAGFIVFGVDELKKIDHRSFLTLFDGVAFFDGLSKCDVFAGLLQQELVQDTVRFTGCSADRSG